MYYTVIKHDDHLRTRGKCRKHEPQASDFFIYPVFSNDRSNESLDAIPPDIERLSCILIGGIFYDIVMIIGLSGVNSLCNRIYNKFLDRAPISNSNWTEWSTIQGVIARVISKSDEREARGRFEITSTITP